MVTINGVSREVLLILCKDFSRMHSITYLAREVNMSRVGMWKVIKNLKEEELITLTPISKGKTSVSVVRLNWDNIILKKALELYLTEESEQQRRWKFDFKDLEKEFDFLILFGSILHSPKTAKDIDILGIASKKRNSEKIGDNLLKIKKKQILPVHDIIITNKELLKELSKPNRAYLEIIKKGVVLYGQDKYISFIKKLHHQ